MKRLLTILAGVALLAVSYHASASVATPTLADVLDYDTLVISADETTFPNPDSLDNSGNAEELWVEGVLGFDVNYIQLADTASSGSNWESVTDGIAGDYAFDLSAYDPAYFLVKVGGGGGTGTDDTHYLFDNASSMSWAFLNLSVFGDDVKLENIGVVSHVGVADGIGEVPIPAAVWLFGSGLIGLVAVGRRKV